MNLIKAYSLIAIALASTSALALSPLFLEQLHQLQLTRAQRGGTRSFQRILADGTFTQKTDHFHAGDTRTFQQRFAIYKDFADTNTQNSPVLYYLCGEWDCFPGGTGDAASVPEAVLLYAKNLKAVVVVLEHRYYGKSQVFTTPLSPENLSTLTYEQALEDFAIFERNAVKKYNLGGKWISVGGSYPGALTAYYRQQHPDLVVGALSSSGVVKTVTAFEDYDRMVAQGLGSECLHAVQTATHEIEQSLNNPEKFEAIKKLFEVTTFKTQLIY